MQRIRGIRRVLIAFSLLTVILWALPFNASAQGYWRFTGDIVRHVDNNDPKYPRTKYSVLSSTFNSLSAERLDTWTDGTNWNKYGFSFTWSTGNNLDVLRPGETFSATGTLRHSYRSSKIPPWGEATAGLAFDDYGLLKSAVKYNLPVLQLRAPTNGSVSRSGTLPVPNGPLGTKMSEGKFKDRYLIVLRAFASNGTSMAIDRVYEWVEGSSRTEPNKERENLLSPGYGLSSVKLIRGTAVIKKPNREMRVSPGETIWLEVGDRIETGSDTRVDLVFPNGSVFRIKSNTVLIPEPEGVRLLTGGVWVRLQRQGWNFQVVTPSEILGVLGTEFYVHVDKAGNTESYAISNQIWVEDLQKRKRVVLNPGQKTVVLRGGVPTDPKPYSRQESTALWEREDAPTAAQPAVPLATGPEKDLFSTFNSDAVVSGPAQPATFGLSKRTFVTLIQTYHWNNGQGAKAGTIGLKGKDGTTYGPWQAVASDASGARRVFWTANPNMELPPGTYTVLVSDMKTWSQNSRSGGRGFVLVRGREGQ